VISPESGHWLGCGSNTEPDDAQQILQCALDPSQRVDCRPPAEGEVRN
jgi:hypothetical protein